MTIKQFASKHNLDLAFYSSDNNISICLGEYQYDCTIQRDGSIYNDDYEIYHASMEEYHQWIIQEYEEAMLVHNNQ